MKINKKKVGAILMMAAGAGLIAHAVYKKKKGDNYTQIIGQPEDNKEKEELLWQEKRLTHICGI